MFGDNYNDLSMLEAIGLGVAMGNADDAIKARADLTIADHMQPGIAEVIHVIRTRVLGSKFCLPHFQRSSRLMATLFTSAYNPFWGRSPVRHAPRA